MYENELLPDHNTNLTLEPERLVQRPIYNEHRRLAICFVLARRSRQRRLILALVGGQSHYCE